MLNFLKKRLTKPAAKSCCSVNIREMKSEEEDVCYDSKKLGDDKDTGRKRASQYKAE